MLNKVIHGDCLELMKNIPDKSIDMILCDTPYGVTGNRGNWDKILPVDKLWQEYKRIIKSNGAIVLTAINPYASLLICSNMIGYGKKNKVAILPQLHINHLECMNMY